jgi:hypothetical protein
MAQPCEFCPSVVSFDEDYNPDFIIQDDYFHQPCPSCDDDEYRATDLCAWCEHLRLRHLVKCLEVHEIWPRPHFYMRPNLLTDIPANDCVLCRIFRYIVLSMSHKMSVEDLDGCCMELYFEECDESIRGWFTSNKFDDMVGPAFQILDTGTSKYGKTTSDVANQFQLPSYH